MGEEKEKAEKLTVELKKEDRELLKALRSTIEGIGKSSSKPEPKAEAPTEEHTHFNVGLDYLANEENCPECRLGLEKFGKDYMKKVLTERKDYPEICVECGTPVQREEEECPTCGGKHSRSR